MKTSSTPDSKVDTPVKKEISELSEFARGEQLLQNVPMITQAALSFVKFNHGREEDSTTSAQPCEPRFLEALLRDVFVLTHLASRTLLETNLTNLDLMLPQDARIVARNLCEVMRQCRRLKASPKLFPSTMMRAEFLKKLSKVSPIMSAIPSITNMKHEVESFRDCTTYFESGSEEEKIPHPNVLGRKNPWNHWLENSAQSIPGWIAIEQKIPRYGDKLIKRITLEYDTIEADFTENELLLREQDKPIGIQPPGHELQHMTWSGFATIPFYFIGYGRGERHPCDTNGVFTLEHICRSQIFSNDPVEGVDLFNGYNFPYFRFAVGCPET